MDSEAGDPYWWCPSEIVLYRQLTHSAYWSPLAPYPADGGRFDDGRRLTLYLAKNPQAAAAEFFRRHPELLEFQHLSRIRVFQVDLRVEGDCLDVRTEECATAAGIEFARLTSSDANVVIRYAECRALAIDVDDADGAGIAYPSAAWIGSEEPWNLVVFGRDGELWRGRSFTEFPRPWVDPSTVVPLPS